MRTQTEKKREREKQTVGLMVGIYCHGKHKTPKGELCPECTELQEYTSQRIEKCPFMETKTFCSHCRVHCYRPDRRDQIKQVMRYAGPRMLWHCPKDALRHSWETLKSSMKRKD